MLEQKQNVFDDYIAAAEWLIANSYTSAARLAIRGQQWRPAGGGVHCSARTLWGRGVRETRNGYATLSQIYCWSVLGQ